MEENLKSGRGFGITATITVVLVALKLAGITQYSWGFAFMPLLVGIGIKLFILLIWLLWFMWQKWSW